jgi:beta-glucosidase
MKKKTWFFILVPIALFIAYLGIAKENTPDDFVENLLRQMTLEEKIGQMTQICFSEITLNGNKNLDMNPDLFRKAILENHVGSFLSGTGPAHKWVSFITELQRVAVEEARLGIPLIIGIDHIHGANYVDEGTMLPHNITLSCSFDKAVISEAARITAVETSDLGMNWNFAPVLDLGKNQYWPRLYETFGEDPLVCAEMGAAFITTYQNPAHSAPYRLAACAKHFIGYSDPRSGWDRTPAEIPDQVLYEHHLPPFKKALDAGVKTVMVNSGEVNGVPVHVSKRLLNDLLREQLGFDGVIVTDIKDIMKVHEEHKGAFSEKDATLRALQAGIDVSMSCNCYTFIEIVKELLAEGTITEKRIDESVRRILRLKYDLGLFENPYPRNDRFDRLGSDEHLASATLLAEESIVLLKNHNDLLPLQAHGKKILVTGFAANSKKMLNGAWTLEWLGAEESRQPQKMNTLYQAIKKEFPVSVVSLFETATDGSIASEAAMQQAVRQNDIIILTLGEEPYSEFRGNISNLQLSPQQELLARIAGSAGKKVVYVLIQGRPRTITSIEPLAEAILFAGYPGQGGADALAGILSGRVNPSGKLTFSYPRYPGHLTTYYHKVFDKSQNLYEFGHGLSYSRFAYSNLQISNSELHAPGEELTIRFDIINTGNLAGKEAVLYFFRQEKGTITRPVKKLFHFEKVYLESGETRNMEIKIIPMNAFAYPDEYNNRVLEDGEYTIMIGDMTQTVTVDTGKLAGR